MPTATSFPMTVILDGTIDITAPHVSEMHLQFVGGHLQVGNSFTLGKLAQQASTVSVTGDVTVKAMELSGGTMKISGTLHFSGSTTRVSTNAALELDGGTIVFANSGGEIIVKNGMSVGPLTLKGVGTLALNGFISGWHDETASMSPQGRPQIHQQR